MAPHTPTYGNGTGYSTPTDPAPIHPTAVRRTEPVIVESDVTSYTDSHITAKYEYKGAHVVKEHGRISVKPTVSQYEFKTARKVQKTGLMMVGLGGNNGTTLTATILANRHNITWRTKEGPMTPNYIGSLLRASTMRLGTDPETGRDFNIPVSDVLPMVHPNDLVIGGWDISSYPLDAAMDRAQVLDWDLQRQLIPYMAEIRPLPSIYYPDFIAANQSERADNLIPGEDKQAHVEKIRKDIRDFKAQHGLDRVVVFWTANTERYSEIIPGVNDTADALLKAIRDSHSEVSPSTVFAVASILEDAPFINGAPQNTFVPGCIELAEKHKSFIGGDDLKSGQTKIKSVLAEYLVNAGIKPLSIASYNHLGNNDGRNLSQEAQFKSKEISKSSVVDDMVDANRLLYRPAANGEKKGEHPDHLVVIKYVPAVGDSKRRKHAKIVKKLRHRRRMTLVPTRSEEKQSYSDPSDVVAPVLEIPKTPVESIPSAMVSTVSPTKSISSTSSTVSGSDDEKTSSEESGDDEPPQQRQVVPYNRPTPKVLCRSQSDIAVSNVIPKPRVVRSRSESHIYLSAIPLHPPPSVAEAERPQHPDEETDRYLAHLFTRSPVNFTDDQTLTTQGNRTEDFAKLRNLFSSDASSKNTQAWTSAEIVTSPQPWTPQPQPTLRADTSCETSYGLNTLFGNGEAKKLSREQCCFKPGLPSALSDASLGLNTLFGNNKTTLKESTSSCETTSVRFRILFDEKRQPQTTTSTLGLNSEKGETTVGSPSPRSHVCSCQCKTVDGLPSVASSSSLLGNLFGSDHAVHDGDELLTAKERKKAIVAKDLAHYLNSDDERTHPKSTSLSTFVQQIEALFNNYRVALHKIENLKAELAELKGQQ